MPRTKTVKLPKIEQLPSGSYHCHLYSHTDDQGKRVYVSLTDQSLDALTRRVLEFKADKKIEKLSPAPRSFTVADALDAYITNREAVISPSTLRSYRSVSKYRLQSIMHLQVSTLRQEDIQKAINQDAKTVSPKTIHNAAGLLSAALEAARPDFHYRVTLPQKEKSEICIPTEENVRLLLQKATGTELELPVTLAALCGMRLSEIAALRREDIDLKSGLIHIRHSLVHDGKTWIEKRNKTTESTRDLKIGDTVKSHIQNALTRPNDNGDYITLDPYRIEHRYRLLVRDTLPRSYTFHALRHYTCSVMLQLNIPKNYIASYLGHSTENMIDKVYGHIMSSKRNTVDDLLNDFYKKTYD